MDDLYIKIGGGPIAVVLTVVLWAILLRSLHRRADLTVPRALIAAAVCVYVGGVVANTLFPIIITGHHDLSRWWAGLNLTPLIGTEPDDMAENVLVFVPIGVLLALAGRVDSVRRVVLLAFLISLGIETIQFVQGLFLGGGHVADINDLLANTLGAPIGYAALRAALLLPAVRRSVESETWSLRRVSGAKGWMPRPAVPLESSVLHE